MLRLLVKLKPASDDIAEFIGIGESDDDMRAMIDEYMDECEFIEDALYRAIGLETNDGCPCCYCKSAGHCGCCACNIHPFGVKES